MAWVGADRLARFHLAGSALSAGDFGQYCEAVLAAAAGGRQSMSPNRSFLVARLLAPLVAPLGAVDALVVGAIVGLAGVVAGVALWAHALAGRTAAVVAALSTAAVAPLVLLARTPSFYPAQHAAFAIASGTAAMAITTRRTGWLVAAAAAESLAPSIDQRGVFWLVACGALVGIAALLPPVGEEHAVARALGRLALVVAIGAAGWPLARWVWAEGGGLEPQVWAFAETVTRNGRLPGQVGSTARMCAADEPFRWGWSAPWDLGRAVGCLRAQIAAIPSFVAAAPSPANAWRDQVAPWVPVAAGAGIVAVASLWRRPLHLAALHVPLVPLWGAIDAARVEPDVRRLATLALAVPVLLGVAFSVLAEAGRGAPPGRWSAAVRPLVVATVAAVVLGALPTWLSPVAAWRVPFSAGAEWGHVVATGGNRTRPDAACHAAVAAPSGGGRGALAARWVAPLQGSGGGAP